MSFNTQGLHHILGIGLALVCFLLVALLIVKLFSHKNLPATPVPGTAVLNTMDKIILFAFILCLVGVVLYGFLQVNQTASVALEKTTALSQKANELSDRVGTLVGTNQVLMEKYTQLKQEDDNLKLRVLAIEEPKLKARSSGLEVLNLSIIYDLTKWQAVDQAEIKVVQKSEFVMTTLRTLWKAQSEATTFSCTFGTSSPFEPVFSCNDFKFHAEKNNDPIPPGKHSLNRWLLDYDISNGPLFQPFDITTTIKVWNSFQNTNIESEGTLINFSTRHASLKVLFPPSKHPLPGGISCSYFGLAADKSPTPIPNPNLTIAPDGTSVTWFIDEPRLGYHYEIFWKW